MRLKSFHGRTMAEAMRQVRDVLGDDAIIVATREEEGVGVRVTAAVEEDMAGAIAASPGHAPPRQPQSIGPNVLDAIGIALARHGVADDLRDGMLECIEELDLRDPLMGMAAALDASFKFQPLPDGKFPKPVMLVGPPGSGKTLAVAKLCARAVLKGRPICVISTDTDRAGGIEQLQAFTRLLRQRLITVEDAGSLGDALLVQRGAEHVLVDSAGRNPFSESDMRLLREQLAAADVEPILVLAAGIDPLEAIDMAHAFRAVGVRRLMPARIDVARRLGSLLAAAHAADFAFTDASVSAKVAEGMTPLSPTALARLLMPEAAAKAAAADAPPRRSKQTGTHP
jgi:flagellar biosynthesis protein FlhF